MGFFNKIFNKVETKISFGDIILLWCFESPRSVNDGFSRYFEYIYGINPKERAQFLIKEGYLVKATALQSLSNYKISQLKELCRTLDLPIKGNKTDLINKLKTVNNLDKFVNSDFYALSDLGKNTLVSHYDYVKYHKNTFDLDIDEFLFLLKEHGDYESAITNYLDKNEITLSNMEDWGLYRNNKLKKANLQHILGKFDLEYLYYLETFYCDLSGYGNGFRSNLKELLIAPGIVKFLKANSDYFSNQMIDLCIAECKVPKHYFDKNQFIKVINYLLENDTIDIEIILRIKKS